MKIEDLACLEKSATARPWAAPDKGDKDNTVWGPSDELPNIADCVSPADAHLIAAVRNALPEILEVLRAAKDLQDLRMASEHLGNAITRFEALP